MFVLLKKELGNFFSSAAGFIIIAVFLTLTGSFLWLIPLEYNILDSGYANVDGLFILSPWLFLFLVPALTMRLFSDEASSGTLELLLTKPLKETHIVLAKFFAGWLLSLFALFPTLLYMVSVGLLGVSAFNLDTGAFWGSFIGLVMLSAVYTSVGLFCSALCKNSIVSFTLSALLCFLAYYGFELIALLIPDAFAARWVSLFGIASHYDSMSRGVIDLSDICYFVCFVSLFILATVVVLNKRVWHTIKRGVVVLIAMILVAIPLNYFFVLRLDLTQEKRYTLSDNTKELMRSLPSDVHINVYLDGDMNPGFLRLKESAINLLKEMNTYSHGKFDVDFVNPSASSDQKERDRLYSKLESSGLKPTMVYDRDASGGVSQKILFPWAVVGIGSDSVNVNMLKNIQGYSGDENLNASIESLEYEFTDAIRRLTNTNPCSVAFIEGHSEWDERHVMSATQALSAYYNVDRGVLGNDASVLDNYKVIIIAGPIDKFSESDKFIIDQYIMNGGSVLWLIDGVRTDKENVGIANEISLDDMLFTYGVRISPLLLLDTQCAMVPINVALDGEQPKFEPMPWYYAPILVPNPSDIITRNLSGVKADFSSVIELVGENKSGLTASALLFSSARAGLDKAPMQINPGIFTLSNESEFFSFSYLPVAVCIEGSFTSVFANRMVPPSVTQGVKERRKTSDPAKVIFVADGDIIRNDIHATSVGYSVVPLGYDEYMGQMFGNEQFILNAVNYLADDEGWLQLRGREFKIRLLDKKKVVNQRITVQILNILLPLLLLIIFNFVYQVVRRNKWTSPLKL